MSNQNLNHSQAFFDYIQNLFTQSLKARQDFDRFWQHDSSNSSEDPSSMISGSLESFQNCLSQLQNPPPDLRLQRTCGFLKEAQSWQNGISSQKLLQLRMDHYETYLLQLWKYLDFLNQLKKLLHGVLIDNTKQLPSSLTKQLRQIDPIAISLQLYLRYGISKLLLGGLSVLGMALLLLIAGGIWYFYTPYQVSGIFIPYSNSNRLLPAPTAPTLFEKASFHFEVPGNGEFHMVTLNTQEKLHVEQFLIGIDLRPERMLEIKEVHLRNTKGQVVHTYDFRTFQQKDWNFLNQIWAGYFQIHEKALQELEKLNTNRAFLNRLASQHEIEDTDSIFFSASVLEKLNTIMGQTYNSKKSFNEALEALNLSLDRRHQKLIRIAAQLPIYKHKVNQPRPILLSPLLHPQGQYRAYAHTPSLQKTVTSDVLGATLTRASINEAVLAKDLTTLRIWEDKLQNTHYERTKAYLHTALEQIEGIQTVQIILKIHYPPIFN